MAVRGDWGFAARDSEEQYVINHACKGRALAKLKRTDPQTNHIFANLCHCSDPADLPLELRGIAGPTEWTLLHWFSTVDRPVRCSTNVKRVVHVIIELAGICGVFLTGRQDFSCLKEGRNILFKSTESNTISDTRSNYTLGMMVISIIPAHRGITSYRTA